ncbi:MAG: oligoendopeptidase F [Eubacteriales bacterium]|nr:oligoendopeptidase F [Eubacteriales bacterium]
MSEKVKERQEIEEKYQWDLTPMFADDAAWEAALKSVDGTLEKAAAFQGTLKDAKMIAEFLKVKTELELELDNLFTYASLRQTEDTRAEQAQSMYSRAYAKYVQISSEISFASPEILKLSEEELKTLVEAPELEDYHYMMTTLLREKPHTLSESEEKLLSSLGEVFGAPRQIAGNLRDADMSFGKVLDGEGKEHELSSANYILLQTSKDRELRKNAFTGFYKAYQDHINTFAASYAGQVKAAAATAKVRRYDSSRALYMADENIPAAVYDNLIASVHKFMPLMYRYVALRKKILGLDELHYYDVYAPLAEGVPKSYTYEQAQQMVLDAVKPLGEEYGTTVKQGFKDRWIDVYPNKGKRGGAYSSGTYTSYPYIMTNFVGTLDSVSTLAHEMGHSMHTWLASHHQTSWNAGYTIFVAEVASTVNENLLVEQLLDKCEDPVEKMALLNEYLEGFKGTLYRQTMFAEFEKEAHAMEERGEALNASSLNALYKRLIGEYFGPEMVVDEEVALEWARIPHFYTPFYVYKYATSYAASIAISERILKEGKPAADQFLNFLSLGGSMDPLDALKTAGVDLTSPEPVDRALEKFGRVLDEAEKLLERKCD